MKVSVIVPVYNVEDYLEKCLFSLVNQTLRDIEIIVVNDGSTDNSQDIVDKYKKDNSNIKSYIQKNKGQAAARNFGLRYCTSDYVTYVDGDDYIELNMLESLYNEVIKDDYDIIISDIIKEEDGKAYVFKNYWKVKDEVNKNFMTSHMGPVARLYKRKFLLDNKFRFLEGVIYEDLGSIPMLGMYTNKIGYVDSAYYHYVIRNGSSMKQIKYNKKMEDIFKVMDNLSNKISEEYNDELEYLYIEHLLYSASLRFISFNKKDMLLKIKEIMHSRYSNYRNNIYYRNKSIKFKIICLLSYNGNYGIIRFLRRISDS